MFKEVRFFTAIVGIVIGKMLWYKVTFVTKVTSTIWGTELIHYHKQLWVMKCCLLGDSSDVCIYFNIGCYKHSSWWYRYILEYIFHLWIWLFHKYCKRCSLLCYLQTLFLSSEWPKNICTDFDIFAERIDNLSNKIVIVGDFNIHVGTPSKLEVSYFLTTVENAGFQ